MAISTGQGMAPELAANVKERIRRALKVFEVDPSSQDIKGAHFHCDYCKKDITNVVRIHCAVCPDFDMCVECFSVGVEIKARDHRAEHDYHLIEPSDFPIITREWTADEELLLLEGIETMGFGNWEQIAEHVGTKSKHKCRKHYIAHYLECPTFPMPQFGSNLVPLRPGEKIELSDDEADIDNKPAKMEAKDLNPPQVLPPNPTPLDLAGYMSKRGDYSTEFENDAELILADLSFASDDSPEDRLLKLRILDIYNSKLDQRTRRKKFARERGLLDIKKLQTREKKMLREDRNLVTKLRPFARHQSAQENDLLVNGLMEEMRLRREILRLKEMRQAGVRTLTEGEQWETFKRKKEDLRSKAKSAPGSTIQRAASRGRQAPKVEAPVTPSFELPKRTRKVSAAVEQAMALQDILSEKERQICSVLRISAQQYVAVKNSMLVESFRVGHLKKTGLRNIVKLDLNKAGKLYDFFVECKWVNPDPDVSFTTLPDIEMTAAAALPPSTTPPPTTATSVPVGSTLPMDATVPIAPPPAVPVVPPTTMTSAIVADAAPPATAPVPMQTS
eukprot:TRINITY_DN14052_c0_g1_i1.p1 TRINITY_DN14052_c0_g1~~TRINITY_DN14052_c0_g1_i1.p1  ORF type:complete len:592 (+),score=133.18 TRINITY_DN14052_c0_g1_i1:95-1777(+)